MSLWDKKPWMRRAGTFGDRQIPARLDIIGNVPAGKMLKARGLAQLNMLETNQRLPQEWMTRRYPDGVVIECYSSAAVKQIRIHVPVPGGIPEKYRELKCFCTCHLAKGTVFNTQYGCYSYMDKFHTYDVEVCTHNPYRYIEISGVKPMMLVPFVDGQEVLMVFEPDNIDDPYLVGMQGCEMIRCRITHLDNNELRFWEE